MYDVSRDVDELLSEPISENHYNSIFSYESEPFNQDVSDKEDIIVQKNEYRKPFHGVHSFCKRFYNIIAIIASIIIVACMLIVIFSNSLLSLFDRFDFISPRDRFIKVETDSAYELADVISSAYGKYYSQLCAETKGYDVEVHLLPGDQLMEKVNLYLPEADQTDLSWIDDIAVSMNIDQEGLLIKTSAVSMLKDDALISTNSVLDLSDNTLVFQIPELSKEYLLLNLNAYYNERGGYDFSKLQIDPNSHDKLVAALPSEQVFNQLLKKYFSLVIDQVQNVQKNSFTFSAGNMEVECSQLTVTLTEKEFIDICILVLQTVRSDELVLGIFEDIAQCSSEKKHYDQQAILNEIDHYILDLNSFANNAKDDQFIKWTVYVDNQKNIIGRRIRISGMDRDYFTYTLFDGDNFAYGLDWFGIISIKGKGNRIERLINADFDVYAEQDLIAQISMDEFDIMPFINGNYSGRFTIKPSMDFTKELFGDGTDSQMKFIVDMKTTNLSSNYHVDIYVDDNYFLGLTFKKTERIGNSFDFPDYSMNLLDEIEYDKWLENVDFKKLKKNLSNANIPPEFSSILEGILSGS